MVDSLSAGTIRGVTRKYLSLLFTLSPLGSEGVNKLWADRFRLKARKTIANQSCICFLLEKPITPPPFLNLIFPDCINPTRGKSDSLPPQAKNSAGTALSRLISSKRSRTSNLKAQLTEHCSQPAQGLSGKLRELTNSWAAARFL